MSAVLNRLNSLERERRRFPDPRLDLNEIGVFGHGPVRNGTRITFEMGVNSTAHRKLFKAYMAQSFPTYFSEWETVEDNGINNVMAVPSKDGSMKRLIALEEDFIRSVPEGYFTIL